MDGNEECVKRNEFEKTFKHTRWKRGEIVFVENGRKNKARVVMVE